MENSNIEFTPLVRGLFIPSEKLGILEANIHAMLGSPRKRGRAVELNAIQFVLKKLKVIPSESKVVGISYGCLDNGDIGIFISFASPTKVLATIPQENT